MAITKNNLRNLSFVIGGINEFRVRHYAVMSLLVHLFNFKLNRNGLVIDNVAAMRELLNSYITPSTRAVTVDFEDNTIWFDTCPNTILSRTYESRIFDLANLQEFHEALDVVGRVENALKAANLFPFVFEGVEVSRNEQSGVIEINPKKLLERVQAEVNARLAKENELFAGLK